MADIRALLASGCVPTIGGRFVAAGDAVEVVRSIRTGTHLMTAVPELFQRAGAGRREAGVPFAGSALAHALMLGGFVLLMGMGTPVQRPPMRLDTTSLVFLAIPGPGGGGGGGGLKQPAPPPRAELAGTSRMRSPVPTRPSVQGPKTEPQAGTASGASSRTG